MIVALAFATTLIITPEAPPDKTAPAKFVARCSGAAIESAECQALLHDVNRIVLRNLLAMEALQVPIDKTMLRAAAASSEGALQAVALRGFGRQALDKADEALVIDALSSPFPGVRAEAVLLSGSLSDKSIADRQKRAYEDRAGNRTPRLFSYIAEDAPSEQFLRAPIYANATYEFFASGPKRAYFTTSDSVEQVVAFYTKGGKKAKTIEQLEADKAAPAPRMNPMEVMRRVTAGENAQKVIADIQARALGAGASGEMLNRAKGEPGTSDVRAIEFVPRSIAGGTVTPPVYVIIFKDDLLGKTGILLPREPITTMDLLRQTDGTPNGITEMNDRFMILNAPIPRTEGTDPN